MLGWSYHEKHPEVSFDDSITRAEAYLRDNPNNNASALAQPSTRENQSDSSMNISEFNNISSNDRYVSPAMLRKIAENVPLEQYDAYSNIGIRIEKIDRVGNIGDEYTHLSSTWIEGIEQDEKLSGISTVDVRQARWFNSNNIYGGYEGTYGLILGANDAIPGNDEGELIMRNPKILARFRIIGNNNKSLPDAAHVLEGLRLAVDALKARENDD